LRLTHLEIFGFKSFAQKIVIPFDPGITAIVGPNGCGKSNVVEAIRWVLGEQRAGAFRSHRMEEVIFSGTRGRKPLGMSEVALTIENSDNTLPIEFNEVTLTRRLFRSGESDYLLNKIPCRLLDIHNLLMDTGLGQGSYAVMEQGMVDEIISEKTENRRRILEEASGITKYKTRRRSTWSRLEATQADLSHIETSIAERKRLVDILSRQVSRARRYQEHKTELDELEVRLGRFRFFAIKEELTPQRDELERLTRESESGYTQFRTLETELEKLKLTYIETEKVLQSVGLELNRYNEEIHEKDRQRIALRGRLESATQNIERAKREHADHQRQLEETQQQRAKTSEDLTAAQAQLETVDKQLQSQLEGAAAAEQAYIAQRNELATQKSRQMELLRTQGEFSRSLERLQTEREGVVERSTALQEESARLVGQRQQILQSHSAAAAALEQTRTQLQRAQQTHQVGRQRLQNTQAELRQREENRTELRRVIDANQARLHVMDKVRSGYEGYASGVRALMLESPHADLFQGVLGDLIDVDPRYHQAVETALGESLEALVAKDQTGLLESIDYLKSHEGRAGIFPLAWHTQPTSSQVLMPQCPGLLGPILDYVKAEGPLASLIGRLLHNTFLVDDLATALDLAATYLDQRVRFVTPSGDAIDLYGRIAGGQAGSADASVLGRRREIATLRDTIAHAKAQWASAAAACKSQAVRQTVLGRHLEGMAQHIDELRDRQREQNHRQENAATEGQRLEDRLEQLRQEEGHIGQRIEGLETAIGESGEKLAGLEQDSQQLENTINAAESQLTHTETARRQRQEQLQTLQVERARGVEQTQSLKRDAERLAHIENSHRQNIERLVGEIERTEQDRSKWTEEVQHIDAELKEMHEKRESLEQDQNEKRQHWQAAMVQSREQEEGWRRMQRDLNTQRERRHQLELQITEAENSAAHIRQRMQEEQHCDVESMGPLQEDDFDVEQTATQVEQLRQAIQRLGTVHVGVLEEYEEEKERYEFYCQQRDDLLVAAEDLKKTLSLIDRTARRMFKETFDEIREKFRETFARFFVGGEADLQLEPNVDPLEANIDISARPRGKRLQSISLLSGGERALTAISLLFAIYQVKPSPFCILDEVDAPLDDTNVGRFVRVLKEFASTTQFIMVTHNKISMNAADTMHGVTMPEEGISQLVSVKIDEELDEAAG